MLLIKMTYFCQKQKNKSEQEKENSPKKIYSSSKI